MRGAPTPLSVCARAYELRVCTDLSFAEIARALNVNRITIAGAVNQLVDEGYAEKKNKNNKSRKL